MKLTKLSLLLSVGSAALMMGCATKPPAQPEAAPAPVAAPAPKLASPAPTPAPVAEPATTAKALPGHLDPASAISTQRSVFFDYDVFSVKPEFNDLIALHGKYLADNAGLSIKVEGHADERGSKSYNLALGQKRAEAVAKALKVFGVKDSQVEATSWGEEKPKAEGHDEAAWAQNRRADIAYPVK
jgi:peptidoglycan-associated lipoprotein